MMQTISYQDVFNSTSNTVIATDEVGRIVLINQMKLILP
jgi:hypothetical protein